MLDVCLAGVNGSWVLTGCVVEQIHRSVLAWASLLQSQGREPCENTATMVMRGMRNLQQRAVKALLEGPDDW